MRCVNCSAELSGLRSNEDLHTPDGSFVSLSPAFCPNCGWPLAHCQASLLPLGGVEWSDGAPPTVKIRLRNEGIGTLYYSIDADDRLRPEALPLLHGQISTGETREISFKVTSPGDSSPLQLELYTLTAEPASPGEARPPERAELWQQQTLTTPLARLQRGPVTSEAGHLLFWRGQAEATVKLLNWGSVDIAAEFQCTAGYRAGVPAGGFHSRGNLTLAAGRAHEQQDYRPGITILRVLGPADQTVAPGQLTLRPEGLPPLTIDLETVVPTPRPQPRDRYAIGIDFGTSKVAVAVVDQYRTPATPRVVEWERDSDSEDPRWLPSAVYYDHAYQQPIFGDAALTTTGEKISDLAVRLTSQGRAELHLGTLFVGSKMALHGPPAEPGDALAIDQVVTDFFGYLFEQLRDREGIDFRQAQVVLSLPVLDSGPAYQQQEQRTRAAAAAAGELFGLSADRILTDREPVCAAIDLVSLQNESPDGATASWRDGQWLCVFDCGAGTTDVSMLQIALEGGQWRFQQVHSVGFAWGGDQVDNLLFWQLLALWCADETGQIPASGPVGLKPEGSAAPPARDLDRPEPEAINWHQFMFDLDQYRFSGANWPVSRAELLASIQAFKEEYLTVTASPEERELITSDPLARLSEQKRGTGDHWQPLDRADLVGQISGQFLEMRDLDDHPLRVALPQLWKRLLISRPDWLTPVGGGTLIAGWQEAVGREPLRMQHPMVGEPALRRLHVARGAARKPLFRVLSPLPEDARLTIVQQVGETSNVLTDLVLTAGSPAGDGTTAAGVVQFQLLPGAVLRLEVRLGTRLLLTRSLLFAEAQEALRAAAGLSPNEAAVFVEVSLGYRARPDRFVLSAVWQITGNPDALPATELLLPTFVL